MRTTRPLAFVTGAGSGIGRAAALRLAADGAHVAVTDIDRAGGNTTVDKIRKVGGTATFHELDVSREGQVAALLDELAFLHGGIALAVNNAGILGDHGITTADYEPVAFDRLIAVNLSGVFYCLKHELRHMRAAGRGAVVNLASEAAFKGNAANVAYTTAKHGVVGMTRTAALELARTGIRVNAVAPGPIATEMMRAGVDLNPHLHAEVSQYMPLGRVGTPEEVADAIAWLLSDAASLITGTIVPLDGGWHVA